MIDPLALADNVRRSLAALPLMNAPSVRAVRRRYSKALADASPASVLQFVRSLLDHAGWAERVVAWEVLHKLTTGLKSPRRTDRVSRRTRD